MTDKNFIQQKIQSISDDLALLKDMNKFSIDEIMADAYRHHAFNNIVQQIIQRAVDINQHILSSVSPAVLTSPKTYRETFTLMGEIGVLPPDFAEQIAGSGSLQNILVHEYDNIEPQKVDEGRRQVLAIYPRYCEYILAYLNL